MVHRAVELASGLVWEVALVQEAVVFIRVAVAAVEVDMREGVDPVVEEYSELEATVVAVGDRPVVRRILGKFYILRKVECFMEN